MGDRGTAEDACVEVGQVVLSEVFRHCFWCDDINPIWNHAINRITDCWNQIPNKVLFQKDGAVVVFVIRTQHCKPDSLLMVLCSFL